MTHAQQITQQEERLKVDLMAWQGHIDAAARIAGRCDRRREKIRRLRGLPKLKFVDNAHS